MHGHLCTSSRSVFAVWSSYSINSASFPLFNSPRRLGTSGCSERLSKTPRRVPEEEAFVWFTATSLLQRLAHDAVAAASVNTSGRRLRSQRTTWWTMLFSHCLSFDTLRKLVCETNTEGLVKWKSAERDILLISLWYQIAKGPWISSEILSHHIFTPQKILRSLFRVNLVSIFRGALAFVSFLIWSSDFPFLQKCFIPVCRLRKTDSVG